MKVVFLLKKIGMLILFLIAFGAHLYSFNNQLCLDYAIGYADGRDYFHNYLYGDTLSDTAYNYYFQLAMNHCEEMGGHPISQGKVTWEIGGKN